MRPKEQRKRSDLRRGLALMVGGIPIPSLTTTRARGGEDSVGKRCSNIHENS